MDDKEVYRRYDGSNAQWLLKQNIYSVLCKAQERMDEEIGGCVLDIIFGKGQTSRIEECKNSKGGCRDCIEDFLYRPHKHIGG